MRWVEVELFYADGQTDVTKLIVAFRNFANAPKKRLKLGYVGSSVVRLFFLMCVLTSGARVVYGQLNEPLLNP